MDTNPAPTPPAHLRAAAIAQLRKKRDLHGHLIAYVTINLILVLIWFASGAEGFFWPMLPLLGWGLGVVFHSWDVYSPSMPSEAAVAREMRRQAARRGPTGS